MTTPDDLERRLTDLEVKLSFADDLLDRLNEVVARQQSQIDLLRREVARLAARRDADDASPASRSLRDEIPPHW